MWALVDTAFYHRKPVLMIVDDDVDQLLLFRISAQRTDVFSEIISAEDGATALNALFSGYLSPAGPPVPMPDVIVTDLKMPDMGGIDFARMVHANEFTCHIPVVMMSSANNPRERDASFAAGCCAFFHKPVELQRLTAIFRSLPKYCDTSVDRFRGEAALR